IAVVTKASHLRSPERCRSGYYEEVLADHRAKEPALKALKREICLQPDRIQCRIMRKALQM
ncbi:MAG: hypothetical protein AB2556_25465, partial [Candidatus Thiodiazotropha sp.]